MDMICGWMDAIPQVMKKIRHGNHLGYFVVRLEGCYTVMERMRLEIVGRYGSSVRIWIRYA